MMSVYFQSEFRKKDEFKCIKHTYKVIVYLVSSDSDIDIEWIIAMPQMAIEVDSVNLLR